MIYEKRLEFDPLISANLKRKCFQYLLYFFKSIDGHSPNYELTDSENYNLLQSSIDEHSPKYALEDSESPNLIQSDRYNVEQVT